MHDQDERQPNTDAQDRPLPTSQAADEALQQAMRREAATREETPAPEQFTDSANQEGMGSQNSGEGRRTGRSS